MGDPSLTYGGYLDLPTLLSAQHPRSRPEHHDELLFVIQHQTSELWFKLVLHELTYARERLAADDLRPALKAIARVKAIQRTLAEQWSVLATLTPAEYVQFRDVLGHSSGFQSAQYRAVEFALGNKDRRMLDLFDDEPEAQATLRAALEAPSLYDEFLRFLDRGGAPVPRSALDIDVTEPHAFADELVAFFRVVYTTPAEHWETYEACEELIDLEDAFQTWRFRHLKTVERIIGSKPGTGGTSGIGFLRRALDRSFFPELYAVRTVV